MVAKNGYVRMRANTEHDVIAACGQQLKRLKGFRNPRAPLRFCLLGHRDVFSETSRIFHGRNQTYMKIITYFKLSIKIISNAVE